MLSVPSRISSDLEFVRVAQEEAYVTILRGILSTAMAMPYGFLSQEFITYDRPFTKTWWLSERFVHGVLVENRNRHRNDRFLAQFNAVEFWN